MFEKIVRYIKEYANTEVPSEFTKEIIATGIDYTDTDSIIAYDDKIEIYINEVLVFVIDTHYKFVEIPEDTQNRTDALKILADVVKKAS
jgi:hypothetical protein